MKQFFFAAENQRDQSRLICLRHSHNRLWCCCPHFLFRTSLVSPRQKSREVFRSKSPLPDTDSSPPSLANHNSDRLDSSSVNQAPRHRGRLSQSPAQEPCPPHPPAARAHPAHS